MYKLLTFMLLGTGWVLLSGQLDFFHLALGVISVLFVIRFSSDFLFTDRSQTLRQRLRQARLLPGYVAWLIYEIFLANLHVMQLALHPAGLKKIHPSILHFKTHLRSDFARWLLANSITLTPGTVTIKADGGEFYVHAISKQSAVGLGGEMERRISHIFEPGEAA